METWLAISPWPGGILWIILYISDYYLTIYAARGFREIGRFQFEGSYELTPQFQKDVDSLRSVSRLHLILLVLYSLIIVFLWWLTMVLFYLPWAYLLYLGLFLLIEVAVHFRHLRNIFLIREIRKNGGVDGQISYRKWFSYKLSAFDFYSFSGLFLLVALMTFSPFFLGGSLICVGTAFKHSRLAKKAKLKSLEPVDVQT
jgi:hypothetical protein